MCVCVPGGYYVNGCSQVIRLAVVSLLEAVHLVLVVCATMDWACPVRQELLTEPGTFSTNIIIAFLLCV